MKVNYTQLDHCPEKQLIKKHDTDAGWDLAAAKDIWIPRYEDLNRKSEIVEIKEPQFFHSLISTEVPCIASFVYADFASAYEDLKQLRFKLDQYGAESRFIISEAGLYQEFENQVTDLKIYLDEQNHEDVSKLTQANQQPGSKYHLQVYLGTKFRSELLEHIKPEPKQLIERVIYKPVMIPTGICIAAEKLAYFDVRLRSSMIKRGLSMAHCIGTIDHSYNNEIFIPCYALDEEVVVLKGEKIGQLIPKVQVEAKFVALPEPEFVNSGRGGFGSTGI